MLVLSRKKNEKILIGENIAVTVVEILGDRVRLGITAPDTVRVMRAELAKNWQDHKKKKNGKGNGLERPPA